MAQLKSDPIVEADLVAFLESQSDFAFELSILKLLVGKGMTCAHGGTYIDPTTKKPREFDIQAVRKATNYVIRLAVECKNVRDNCPLLISCVPRLKAEAFHEVLHAVDPEVHNLDFSKDEDGDEDEDVYIAAMALGAESIRWNRHDSWYFPGDPVGKSCEQVGRTLKNELTSEGATIYDKWSQALGSADGLVDQAGAAWQESRDKETWSLVVPIVVIPNGRLWVAEYDKEGNRFGSAKTVDRCSYFVNRSYECEPPVGHGCTYTISHLEFLTVDGLEQFVDKYCRDPYRIVEGP